MRVQLFFIISSIILQLIACQEVFLSTPETAEYRFREYYFANSNQRTSTDLVPTGETELCYKRFYCEKAIEMVQQHMEKDLQFSADAFIDNAPPNVVNRIKFTIYPQLNFLLLEQIMYPCYGAHEIIRSSIYLDDYSDLYFISYGDATQNSIIIYRHEKEVDPNKDWFRPLWLIDNVEKPEHVTSDVSSDSSVNMMQIDHSELDTDDENALDDVPSPRSADKYVSYNDDEEEVEFIYLREMFFQKKISSPDMLAKLTSHEITALCNYLVVHNFEAHFELLYDQNIFSSQFLLTQEDLYSTATKRVMFKHKVAYEYNKIPIKQTMFSCVHQDTDDYNTELLPYGISSGPRPASVIVYRHDIITYLKVKYPAYRPVRMIENLPGRGRLIGYPPLF